MDIHLRGLFSQVLLKSTQFRATNYSSSPHLTTFQNFWLLHLITFQGSLQRLRGLCPCMCTLALSITSLNPMKIPFASINRFGSSVIFENIDCNRGAFFSAGDREFFADK